MKPAVVLRHLFVEFIPEQLEDNTVYVSIPYATVAHKCVCGCGKEVVTPLSPTDWQLKFDGETISLDPSIGNWSFECRSHYWIIRDEAQWSIPWSIKQIEAGRAAHKAAKENYFASTTKNVAPEEKAKRAPAKKKSWRKKKQS